MVRLVSVVAYIVALAGLAYYVGTHPNLDQVQRLTRERERLQEQNETLVRQNKQLRRRIDALRAHTPLAARLARQRSGLARPDELIVQFSEDSSSAPMQVRLRVGPETLHLAGRSVSMSTLGEAIDDLEKRWPEMTIDLQVDEGVNILRQSRVRAILDDS